MAAAKDVYEFEDDTDEKNGKKKMEDTASQKIGNKK